MILCCVNDVLSISHDAMKTMKGIQHKFKLKDDKIAEPENCLGTELSNIMTAKMDVNAGPCHQRITARMLF